MTNTSLTVDPTIQAILGAAIPVIQINGVGNSMWRREMKAGDPRIGPWRASQHEVLDRATWYLDGECLYFLRDSAGRIRYVGESKNRLRDRWRTPPAVCATTGHDLGNPYVFHNRAWPSLERAILADSAIAPFKVSVIHEPGLARLAAANATLAALHTQIQPGKHFTRVVQDWLCAHRDVQAHLWNVAGTRQGLRQ